MLNMIYSYINLW